MPDIPRDFLHASPRFSTPEQEWRVPGQAVLKSNDHSILRLYFLEAHQRLTKYLPRSSSTLQKGGDVPRFKRNRVHLCKKKKKGGREEDFVSWRSFVSNREHGSACDGSLSRIL